ncbi:unnamed protein product [Clonostachys rosea f. rosea IK726]|uniref:Uncharacterized protein n=1 Tax=Clonostachys rosea f. rosea IK726 TaxID=1349383 RepID=A0ACA9UT05_BIOOC|nr:unnamed protein product [Clonostachys rosea f. rosea IK726]
MRSRRCRGYFRPRHPRGLGSFGSSVWRKKRSLAEAEAVFYKGQGRQRIRAGGLLSTLSDDEYARVCKFIVDTPTMSFPTPHRIKRAYMRYLGYMMYHVIAWFDPLSAAAASAQAHTTQNKMLLYMHLEAALEKHADQSTPPGTDTLLEPSGTAYTEAGAGYTRRMRMNFMNAPCRLLLLGRSLARRRPIIYRAILPRFPDLIQEFCCQVTRAATHKRDMTALPPEAAAELERSI